MIVSYYFIQIKMVQRKEFSWTDGILMDLLPRFLGAAFAPYTEYQYPSYARTQPFHKPSNHFRIFYTLKITRKNAAYTSVGIELGAFSPVGHRQGWNSTRAVGNALLGKKGGTL